jgi:hypothetical protein
LPGLLLSPEAPPLVSIFFSRNSRLRIRFLVEAPPPFVPLFSPSARVPRRRVPVACSSLRFPIFSAKCRLSPWPLIHFPLLWSLIWSAAGIRIGAWSSALPWPQLFQCALGSSLRKFIRQDQLQLSVPVLRVRRLCRCLILCVALPLLY